MPYSTTRGLALAGLLFAVCQAQFPAPGTIYDNHGDGSCPISEVAPSAVVPVLIYAVDELNSTLTDATGAAILDYIGAYTSE